MSKIILVTGGNRSGKSNFGEELLRDKENVLYIATAVITDEEMKDRVTIHKKKRNKKWKTFEGYRELDTIIKSSECEYIMLECVTTMITNLIFDKYSIFDNLAKGEINSLEESIVMEIEKIISTCRNFDKEIVIITNEVGFGLVSEYKLGRIFTDISGRVNQLLGKLCDEAYLVVSGLPIKLK